MMPISLESSLFIGGLAFIRTPAWSPYVYYCYCSGFIL